MKRKRVAIVGAGPGGLSAAMLLAHQGFEVAVFEKERKIGGRSAPVRLGPYSFDTGPTFLMMRFILDEAFRAAGRSSKDYLQFQLVDPMYYLKFEDIEILCSSNHEEMQEQVNRHFDAVSGTEVREFLASEKKRFEKLMPALRRDYSSWTDLLSKEVFQALPYFGVRSSLFDTLGLYFKPEKLRLSFTFQAKYLGMSPWDCPGGFAIIPYIEHAFGIYHVMGGLFKICEAMAQVTKEDGGRIYTESPVASIKLEGRSAKGVVLENGETVEADYVIANSDFAYTMSSLIEEGKLNRYSPQRLAKKKYSAQSLCFTSAWIKSMTCVTTISTSPRTTRRT